MNKQIEKIPGLKDVLDSTALKVEEIIGRPVTVSYKINILGVTVSELMDIVCEVCDVERNDVLSERRYQELVVARQLFCWFANRELKQTLAHIGKVLKRDHTTVIHSVKTVDDMIYTSNLHYCTLFNTVQDSFNQLQIIKKQQNEEI